MVCIPALETEALREGQRFSCLLTHDGFVAIAKTMASLFW